MGGYHVAPAAPGDDAAINRLLGQRPMGELIRITLERAPSPSAAARAEGERHDTILVRDSTDGSIVGMGSRAVKPVFYNGRICRLGYLGQLRAAEGRHGLKRLAAGFEGIRSTRGPDELPFDLTSIVDDNRLALRLLRRGLAALPEYRPLGKLSTFILPTGGKSGMGSATVATRRELPEIVSLLNRYNRDFQFANAFTQQELLSPIRTPNLTVDDFLVVKSAGRLLACLALWDQRPFKQTVVQSYADWLRFARPLVNLGRSCLRKPHYPRAPFVVPMAYISHFSMPDPDPRQFAALIQAARHVARKRNIHYLAIGFCERHPCHEPIRRQFRHQRYDSTLFSVHWRDQVETSAQELKERIPHPELALL